MPIKEILQIEEIAFQETHTLLHRNFHKYFIPMGSLYAFALLIVN